jgi:hypothetical protein
MTKQPKTLQALIGMQYAALIKAQHNLFSNYDNLVSFDESCFKMIDSTAKIRVKHTRFFGKQKMSVTAARFVKLSRAPLNFGGKTTVTVRIQDKEYTCEQVCSKKDRFDKKVGIKMCVIKILDSMVKDNFIDLNHPVFQKLHI